jgi:hypothetical protein
LLLVWWNLADFYVCKRFSNWPELNETSLVGGVFLLLLVSLATVTRCQIRRGLRGFKSDLDADGPADLSEWQKMLSHIAENCGGLSKQYVYWLHDSGSGWRPWLSAAWLPAVTIFLAFPPLHSGLMESLANFSRRTPPSLFARKSEAKADDVIFAIDSVAEQGKGASIITGLVPQGGRWARSPDSQVESGTKTFLVFHVGDYPHVHRRIEIFGCNQPDCVLPLGGNPRNVRRATARFEYWQPYAAVRRPRPLLNVRAELRALWGHSLDSVPID